ncbi:MAG: hypothetical protein KC502_22370, partial [Myxococcales bacterium]|nr:hypothetical protein [Myxococcales bacterium]
MRPPKATILTFVPLGRMFSAMSTFDPAYSRGFITPYEQVFSELRREVATADDGTQVAYQVVGDGPETVVLANGLGGRLYSWLGLIDPLQA